MQGDGRTLAGVPDAWADGVLSHVVFQHLPDPGLTYGYVRDMGRVLRPGGWAAFQVSNDPAVHRPRGGVARRLRALAGRGPRGTGHPAWVGSAVDLDALRVAAADGHLDVSHLYGEGTQFCLVRLQRRGGTDVEKP
jgi:SAM-dependent methyltransferase